VNWYIVLILVSVSTASDGFFRAPVPLAYEMWLKPYALEVDCKTDAGTLAAQKNAAAAALVPYTPAPELSRYVSSCVGI
jgi:hypothetical protein